MEKEIWKDIPGYEGLYEVSTFGRVRSKDRFLKINQINNTANKCSSFTFLKKGRILSPGVNSRGYCILHLYKEDGSKKAYPVHRLVAITFLPNPKKLRCVNHKDENKTNNHIDNLEWCTNQYNALYGTCLERQIETQRNTSKLRKKVCSVDKHGNVVEYQSIREAQRALNKPFANITRAIITGGYCCKLKWKFI